jgi:hypothetical protein
MKKIFTFLFVVGSIGFASAQSKSSPQYNKDWSAQSGHEQSHQSGSYGSNSTGYNSFGMSARERDQQIQSINREFDQKIAAVKWDRHLRSREKNRQIQMMDRQRNEQIKQVQMHFSGKNRYDDRGYGQKDNRKW